MTSRRSISSRTVCTYAALASLIGVGCGMRTSMGTADDEYGDDMDQEGTQAGSGSTGSSGHGSKPGSSQAGAAAAGSKGGPSGAAGAAGGGSNKSGSQVGGNAAGSAGSRGGAGSIELGGSPSAGSKAGASGGLGSGGNSLVAGSKTSSSLVGGRKSSSSQRDAGSPTDAGTTVPPTINPNSGYASVPAGNVVMNGYVSSYVGGSGSSITLSYNETSFCASGQVGASSTYNSWAGAGFNVNQSQSGSSGSTGSLKLVGSTISVSYENKKSAKLELQLWDGSEYWCVYLPSAKGPATYTAPLSSLNSKCWDGSGSAFAAGTAITTVQLVVPGSTSSTTPFDFCFLGITIQ